MTKTHGATPKKVHHKGFQFDYIAGTDKDDVIDGGRGTQIVDAGAGNDRVSGGSGRDLLFGGSGNDQLVGGRRGDLVFGGSGDDLIDSGGAGHHRDGADALFGDGYDSFGNLVKGDRVNAPGNDTIRGGDSNDLIFGDNGDFGKNGGNDLLEGGRGDDIMFGEGGDDRLMGGRGGDIMDGGAGADTFVYTSREDSTKWDADIIRNFAQGVDKIDLTGVLAGKALNWCGTKPTANGVWYEVKGGCTLICIDLDGNKSPDMVIKLDGRYQLSADDFIKGGTGQQPPANSAPVANNDTASTNEDTAVTINVLANDSDANGDALTVTGASAGHGSVTVNANGTLTYTGAGNFNGKDTISYSISDGKGGTASATVTVNVAAVNDGPVAGKDTASTSEDTAVTFAVLGNDSDADGDALVVTGASAGHGTVVVNANGTLTYTPAGNYNGGDTITYTISDGHGGTATGTVAVNVAAVNDAPVALNDKASTNEDTAVDIAVLANDSDVDGGALAITGASALHGTVTINGNGTLTYAPSANYNGSDTISYDISDGKGGTASATVAVTVNAVNDGPVAGNDTASTGEDTPVTISVLGNDSDPDGDTLTVTGASAAHGSVVVNGNGTLTYTPAGDYNGADTITYTVSDGHGGTASATVTVNVGSVNDGPVAKNDTASTNEDQAVTVAVLGNDSDPDGGTLSVTGATALHGSVVVNGDGTLTYTPDANYNGSDSISYSISDGQGGTASATVAVTVNPVNDGPVAGNDSAVTDEDAAVTISVLGNDSDPDGDALTVTGASAEHGTVTVNGNGTLTYTPTGNYNGADTITYTVSDGHGGTASATVAVTVNPVNDGPIAKNDTAATNEDQAVTVAVLDNDGDYDGGTVTVTGASALHGSVVVNGDGTLTYTPGANYNGSDTIAYSIADGQGGTASATVAVTVNAVNDGPVANDDSVTTDEDTPVTVNVLGNDSDLDGDKLTVTGASAAHGTVTVNGDGTLTYTADANYNGSDTISYNIDDGKGGTASASVAVTVESVNDAPVALDDAATVSEDSDISIDVLANDSDVDGGTLQITGASAEHGTVSVNENGQLHYTPDENYNGADSITYTISDGQGGSSSATVAVTVGPVNDDPVAKNDTATTIEDTAVTIAVLSNDSDLDGDKVTVTGASAANGTVTVNGDGTLTYTPGTNYNGADTITYTIDDGNGGTASATVAVTVNPVNDAPLATKDTGTVNEDSFVRIVVLANDSDVDGDKLTVTGASAEHGTVVINANGSLNYFPSANYHGSDTITYSISDGNGGVATSIVSVTVNSVNDAPVAGGDSAVTDEDTPVTVNVLGNDSDVDGDALAVTGASALHGSVTINANGTLTYSPAANYHGPDTISYIVADGKGGTATASVSVTVNSVNDLPVATDDSVDVVEDNAVTFAPLSNDSDVDGDTLTVQTASAEHGSVIVNSNGTMTYTPDPNFAGTDHVTYTITDGQGGSATAVVTITVNPENDPPVAIGDTAITDEDTPVNINVLANDGDVDGDVLSIESASAMNGTVTVNPDGTLHYAPVANFNGADTITYTISDGHGGTSTATVVVTVNAVNDAPVANSETTAVNEDGIVRIAVLANDSDVDGDALSVSAAAARNGTVVVNSNNTIDYRPNADFFGTDTITYTVSDGHGGTATATVTVTVNAVNDGPTANGETWYVSTGAVTTVGAERLLANDSDRDGGQLQVTAINGAGVGTAVTLANGVMLTLQADGTIAVQGPASVVGTGATTFTYTISDGTATATATSSITVLRGDDSINNHNLSAVTDPYAITYIDVKGNTEIVTGTAGNDSLYGGQGLDRLTGGAGDDLLDGGTQNGEMSGGAGNDTVRGAAGADTLDGGAGSEDMLDLSYATAGISFTLTQSSAITTFNFGGNLGSDKYAGIEGVIGSSFNDTLTGSAANDFIRGAGGNDTIDGGAGTDLIDFGDATGALDFTLVQSSTATNFSAAGLGTDSYKNFEGVAGSSFDDTLTGSASGDVLRGNGGEDIISGGLGDDKLRGGQGADTLLGGSGSDRFEFVGGDLTGAVTDSIGDFQAGAGGDVLDISELLVGYSGSGLENFVQMIDTGDGNSLLRIDIDGSGTMFGFQNAAVLTGVSGVSLTDMVTNGNIDATV